MGEDTREKITADEDERGGEDFYFEQSSVTFGSTNSALMKAIPITVCFLLLINCKFVFAQPGTLDPTFGIGGEVNLHPYFASEQAQDIAITTDGKILLLAKENYLLKLNADGTLDTSFGVQGKFIINDNYGSFVASAIEVDSENRILVYTRDSYWFMMYVLRLLPDGAVDLSFGSDGFVITPFDFANRALCIQSDGKIVVGGYRDNNYYSSANIERLNSDGTADATFNGNGMNSIPILESSYIFAIHQQPDGKLLATGYGDSSMFVAQFNVNGQPDSSFGADGLVTFSGNGIMAGQDVTETTDGSILVVGHRETAEESSMLCWKLLQDGTPDSSFGNNGVVTLYQGYENNFAWFAFANGDTTAVVGGTLFDGANYFPVLYRLLNNGSIDSSFGIDGSAGKTFSCGKSIQLNAVRTADGKMLFAGTAFDNGSNYIDVSQINSDGSIDTSFGLDAVVSLTTDSFHYTAIGGECLVLNDNKILLSGSTSDNYNLVFFRLNADGGIDSTYGHNGYYIANLHYQNGDGIITSDSNAIYYLQNALYNRLGAEDLAFPPTYFNDAAILHKFHADGTPDSSFGLNGITILSFSDFQFKGCTDLALQVDGKLIVAGYETQNVNYDYVFVERLNADGSIDSTFGDNGTKIFDANNDEYHLYVAVRADNKINCVFSYPFYVDVSRLLSDGTFDSTFAINGSESILSGSSGPRRIVLQNDNKMLIELWGTFLPIVRLNEDGSVDSAFADDGFISDGGFGMLLQPDQEILSWDEIPLTSVLITRYKTYGDIDLTFGTNGVATLMGEFSGLSTHSLCLQSDGKILFTNSNYPNFYVARLLNDIGLMTDEPVASSIFRVYPNPASDQLIISNHFSPDEQTTISITDITGKKVRMKIGKFSGDNFTLPVQDLPPGIYMITVRTENNLETAKFVKQ